MRSIILNLIFSYSISAQSNCGRNIYCLAKLSQYVVLGTVVSNTLNQTGSTSRNYNASIAVKCAFASFTAAAPDDGKNLAGQTIDVTRFGGGNTCPAGFTQADVNSTQIFFIHVRPKLNEKLVYTVVDICVGGIISTTEALGEIKALMRDYPENVIPLENRGSDAECQLASITAVPTPIRDRIDEESSATFPWAIVTVIFIIGIAHYLVPDLISDGRSKAELVTHNSEKQDYFVELASLAQELGYKPIIHKLVLSNIKQVIDSIPDGELIMNVCDGSDIDGVPGPSVAKYLEDKGRSFVIGCDSEFILNTTTKNGMKEIFKQYHVSTPLGFPVTADTDIIAMVEEYAMMYPLFVKVSDSYGSVGIDDSSVCHNEEQLLKKCNALLKEFPNLTLEEFIDGQEYSVLISGNSRDPDHPVIVYPPSERAFSESLGQFQKFVSFDRNWDETMLAHTYEKVDDPNDSMALQDLARRAYISVSGNCYGRVDIRKRDVSGKFYVLEVNASCGLGKGTSSEYILKLAGQTTRDFFKILVSNYNTPVAPIKKVETPSLVPSEVKETVSKLITNPTLATVPTPVVHVIVSAVLIDPETLLPDPEGKLLEDYGKDVEYISELEAIFRKIGHDPIVHIYPIDPLEDILLSLDRTNDIVFNACLGSAGFSVATLLGDLSLNRTVGLNAQFFTQSASRPITRQLLKAAGIETPSAITLNLKYDGKKTLEELITSTATFITDLMSYEKICFPVYVKPAKVVRHREGQHSGRPVKNEAELKQFLHDLFKGESTQNSPSKNELWIVEEFISGSEFRVLVAGDGRDPNRDVIVLPPTKYRGTAFNNPKASLASSTHSLLKRKESMQKLDSKLWNQENELYSRMEDGEIMVQMDIQDLARRAYCAVHGSCYGLVHLINKNDEGKLIVLGVQGDVRFGENAKAGIVVQRAGLTMMDLFSWLLQRA